MTVLTKKISKIILVFDFYSRTKNVLLWGNHGTGKTLLLAEALRMKIGFYKNKKAKFKIFVTSYMYGTLLLEDYKQKFLIGEDCDVRFMEFFDLCMGIYLDIN